ncbi:MAG: hypothetical protein WC764_00965 [Candidatus Paceibacterota bacterium]|jgi:hypothetical protein
MKKYITYIVVLAIIVAAGWYFVSRNASSTEPYGGQASDVTSAEGGALGATLYDKVGSGSSAVEQMPNTNPFSEPAVNPYTQAYTNPFGK